MHRYFKMRTLKVILVVDIFLGLAVESREAISSLGVLNSDIEEYLDHASSLGFLVTQYSSGMLKIIKLFVV